MGILPAAGAFIFVNAGVGTGATGRDFRRMYFARPGHGRRLTCHANGCSINVEERRGTPRLLCLNRVLDLTLHFWRELRDVMRALRMLRRLLQDFRVVLALDNLRAPGNDVVAS